MICRLTYDMLIDISCPKTPPATARTRAEILEHAARLFRLRGYAGTNIDDIMLAAGLTRGAFYAHFKSKDDLFAEVIRAGHGLLGRLRGASDGRRVLEGLSRQGRSRRQRAGLHPGRPGRRRRPRAPARPARLCQRPPWRDRRDGARPPRKLDADATVAAILAVGAVSLARAERRHGGSATGCCVARGGPRGLCWPEAAPASFAKAETIDGHAGKPLALVVPNALHDHAVVGPQPHQRRVLLDPADQPLGLGELVVVEATARPPSRRHRSSRRRPRGTAA